MKRLATILALAFAAAAPSVAGTISSGNDGAVYVLAISQPRTVAVSLSMTADYVSVPLRVSSDQKNAAAAYEESRQAIDVIVQKAKESGQFRTTTGVVSLGQHASKFLSVSGFNPPSSAGEVFLLVPLTKERPDLFSAGVEATRFVDGLRLPGKARVEVGTLQLAVENPEQYRGRLLAAVARQIQETRNGLGNMGGVKIDGLENSVVVRQFNDRQVELFLPYTLSVTIPAGQ